MKQLIKNIIGPHNLRCIHEEIMFSKHPLYKSLLKGNREFYQKHSGKRCFILGNGPSLQTVDFSRLENEITFTVNQLPRNPHFLKLHTNYHFGRMSVFLICSQIGPKIWSF